MVNVYLVLATILLIIIFALYLLVDFLRTKNASNAFYNKWTKKLLWLWLPFYALQRLIKEVILDKR